MNLPNKLTVSRIVLAFVFVAVLELPGSVVSRSLALLIFLAASFTDFLDGWIAKTGNMVTDFGRLMDPIADKILVLGAFLVFVQMGIVPGWMVVIIVAREAVVTGLRISALTKGSVIPADDGGKHKMVSQVFSIIAILFFLIFREAGIRVFQFWNQGTERIYKDVIFVLMLITTSLTLISGIAYLVKNKEVYSNAKKS